MIFFHFWDWEPVLWAVRDAPKIISMELHACCVTLDRLLSFSVPQAPHQLKGTTIVPVLSVAVILNELTHNQHNTSLPPPRMSLTLLQFQ